MIKAKHDASSAPPRPEGVELVKPSFWDVVKYLPLYAISLIPMRLLFGLSDLLSFILYHWVKYRREVVAENLEQSFPEKTAAERKIIEKKFYRHFCDLAMESVKALTMPMNMGKRHFRAKNPEILHQYHQQQRSVIFYMGHYGNWEWFTFLPSSIPHQLTSFYQPLSNKYVDRLMKIIRCRFDSYMIASHRGYKSILSLQRQNLLTATMIIGDQSPRPNSPLHWTSFLHRETAFLTGADRIAMKNNSVLLFPAYSKPKRGVYDIEFLLIEDDPTNAAEGAIIDTYATLLEQTIQQAPEMWLWSHKRWKLSRESEKNSGIKTNNFSPYHRSMGIGSTFRDGR